MNAFAFAAAALAAAVLVEAFVPDRSAYHAGWYNVALAALLVFLALRAREVTRGAGGVYRTGILTIAFGAGVLGFAGIANGLLAPDPRTLAGVPGQQVALADLGGTIAFPALAGAETPVLLRPGRAPLPVEAQRYVGSAILRTVRRTVVRVEGYDANGAHLTITQPTGSAFLSPVLLMRTTQRIAGLELPFDSFALPAAHRIVNVVLFTAAQVAAMRGIAGPPEPALLFAVDDETDQPLPHSIRFAHSGEIVSDGGVRLRAQVLDYPAIEVIAAPSLPALAAGCALMLVGMAMLLRRNTKTPSRS
ncbi:MAG TPA: hypothetical protein VIN40_08530 [Candidatus Tyrphobacter sp.]